MKTKKERLREFILSAATFYHFLRMHGIRLAVFYRPARGPQCGHPTRKVTIILLQKGFCVAAVPQPTRKVSIVHLRKFVCVMLHVTGKLFV